MEQDVRNKLQRATQRVRQILEGEFAEQLEGTFDILPSGSILPEAGKHLSPRQKLVRQKLVDAVEHIKAGGKKPKEAVDEYTREAAFTFLNRFVALRMLEARGMLQQCVSKGDQSSGFKEFCGLAPGLSDLPDGGYRLYLECLFDELSVEVKVLFDRRDPASLLWPRRGALTELLEILGQVELAGVWSEDETIGWVYQYFNSGEERKAMRDASQAPRNSRELAVRNQFFTPRYVVEFLTDNTLGRIWYEMRRGQSRLVDECRYLVRRPSEVFLAEGEEPPPEDEDAAADLSQEELLKKTVYIPHRAKKDPRDLKILDPACGSGHFLLYAFDLLLSIYDEAWHDDDSPKSEVTRQTLRADYPELEQLHAALPGLVLAHNLHGIDIDPRAAQIAALALWMRGQRAFNDFGISRDSRPAIARSNIVCAEPMPGEESFLDEFIAEHLADDAEGRFLANLVRKVFDAMKLAGEAGSLLKIEEDIADEVAKAKKQWLERPSPKQKTFFDAKTPKPMQKQLDLTRGITDESFWEEAEQRIYDALRAYSEQAERTRGFQRRLFATDTDRGFAFVDLCRHTYDAVVMNPPFGLAPDNAFSHLKTSFPNSYTELLATFIERGLQLCCGICGAITSRSFMVATRLKNWRRFTIITRLNLLADLGAGVMDAALVEAAAYTMTSDGRSGAEMLGFDVRSQPDRARVLLDAIRDECQGTPAANRIAPSVFSEFPNFKILYALPKRVVDLVQSSKRFEPAIGTARQGLTTWDDFRFIRLNWEVDSSSIGPEKYWEHVAKGGAFGRYYGAIHLLVGWNVDGGEMRECNRRVNGSDAQTRQASDYWRRAGNTYSLRSGRGFSARVLPRGCLFTSQGPVVFSESEIDNAAILGWLNSELISTLIELQSNAGKFMSGIIKTLPWHFGENDINVHELSIETTQLVTQLLHLDAQDETSPYFHGLALNDNIAAIRDRFNKWTIGLREGISALDSKWNRHVNEAYSVTPEVLARLREINVFDDDGETAIDGADENSADDELTVSDEELSARIVSYCFGIAIGRWRDPSGISINDKFLPYDSIPSTTPALNTRSDAGVGALVDDEGHVHDVLGQVRVVFETLWPSHIETVEQTLCEMLRVKDLHLILRNSGSASFFEVHLKRYSRSRRKAPIYWQLATPSASYSVWLYYHRFTRDTFFQILNEYVKPKLNHERQKLERVQSEGGLEPSRSQRKDFEDQEKFVSELSTMAEEIERIAPLWNPDLNDGVIINFAPLWRLVPQHKSWQKECKACWDKLVAGDYDWAHLAMHLWPERVVPKCQTDRSFAIAHDIEDLLWVEDGGKWRPLDDPDEELARLQKRWKSAVRNEVRESLDKLATDSDATKKLSADEACQRLISGKLDDCRASLLLWPDRVLRKCVNDSKLAKKQGVEFPDNLTKAKLKKIIEKQQKACDDCRDIETQLSESLRDESRPFTEIWQELATGERDDERLALSLWPERVINRCCEDVELARVHEFDRYFWFTDRDGSPRCRLEPEVEIRNEVKFRTSPAVKAALKSLLEAPAPTGTAKKRKKSSRRRN